MCPANHVIPPATAAIWVYHRHDDVIKWKHFPRYWSFMRELTGPRWIPRAKVSDAELWCFFVMRLDKRLCKQSGGWWFETLSRPLWRHSNGNEHLYEWDSGQDNITVILRTAFSNANISQKIVLFGYIVLLGIELAARHYLSPFWP